jgi:hypothetical protein
VKFVGTAAHEYGEDFEYSLLAGTAESQLTREGSCRASREICSPADFDSYAQLDNEP